MTIALTAETSASAISDVIRLPARSPNSCAAAASPTSMTGANVARARERVGRHRVEVDDVEQHVERHHDAGAEQQRARQRLLRLLDLAGDVRGGVPARVREQTYISAIANDVVRDVREAAVLRSRSAPSRRCPTPRPATMNTTISATFRIVNTACTRPPTLVSNECSAVIATISTHAIELRASVSESPSRRIELARGTSRTRARRPRSPPRTRRSARPSRS